MSSYLFIGMGLEYFARFVMVQVLMLFVEHRIADTFSWPSLIIIVRNKLMTSFFTVICVLRQIRMWVSVGMSVDE